MQLKTKPATEAQIDYDFEVGIRPGEYQPTFIAKTGLKLYKQPSTDSSIVEGIEIPEGEKIAFNETIYRTVKQGQVKVLASQSITVRSYGLIDWLSRNDYYAKGTQKSIDLKAGDTIEYLQDRAEGECFFRIDYEILAIDEYLLNVEVTSQPVTEWWVRAVDDRQNPIGWVLIDKKDVEFIYPWETAE